MAGPTASKRPYLVRAMHEWMTDNGHTPHIVVDATHPDVVVPSEHVNDGKIILNISHSAAHGLAMNNDAIRFRARFSGRPFDVAVPVKAVLGIYARETGQGMIFSPGGDQPRPPTGSDDTSDANSRRGPRLRVVK
ncbi:MAG: ClpXP protease specificity-enhancing factor [Pseudomonadota bacterium]